MFLNLHILISILETFDMNSVRYQKKYESWFKKLTGRPFFNNALQQSTQGDAGACCFNTQKLARRLQQSV
jgi:hypothetical protein